MERSGEGFNLARVNQASLIDEPARREPSEAWGHGPCHHYGCIYVQWEAEMGGTGELGLYGYLGTFQSRPGQGHVDRELGLRRTYAPTYRLRFPSEAKYPSTAGTPLPTKCTRARTDDKL